MDLSSSIKYKVLESVKRVYKIIIFFASIFIMGLISFTVYINYSLEKKEVLHAVDSSKTKQKDHIRTIYKY
ncbi:hypothetical protein SAMN04487906_0454 [Zhouia amylolytica]|nr:hypothetical protein [Zhouia amylolytica]MCQ0112824.1 hypothetical protein [Zhouia amylolytica]SFS43190.1 hypothetical protein SAMN04487906_0454 [Zhouia amylolytica]